MLKKFVKLIANSKQARHKRFFMDTCINSSWK